MQYQVGDTVRLAKLYGNLPYDGTPNFVYPGDMGIISACYEGSWYPVEVQFVKNLLRCTLDEIEPA